MTVFPALVFRAVPPAPTFRQRGFTLTEMAVVLVIVSLLIGGMLLPLSAQRDIRARQDTDRILADIREALYGYAAANGRLPRPATSATDGAERTANCTTAPDDCKGYIPWSTLGVPKIDGWNRMIRYSVTPAYANAAITLTTIADRKVKTRDSLGAESYLAGQAACNTISQCVPAVVFSEGRYRWGTTDVGLELADGSATNVDEDANHNGPTDYFSRLPTDSTAATGGEIDDVVTWLSTHVLFNRMISAGRLP